MPWSVPAIFQIMLILPLLCVSHPIVGSGDDKHSREVLGGTCESFLATVGILARRGSVAALKLHCNGGSLCSKLQGELQPPLDAVWNNPDLMKKWREFFGDPFNLQFPGWVQEKKRIYLGDYPPERYVEGPFGESYFFRYDQIVGNFYHSLPKVAGEEDVIYIYAHGLNPEMRYEVRDGKKYAAILVGGKPTTAKELVPILERLGYTGGNIRMITCWAGGTGKEGAQVRPFIDDLVDELKGKAQWVKGTEGVLHIKSSGMSPVYTLSSLQNRDHKWGDFQTLLDVDPLALDTREILRFDGTLDRMRTATWKGKTHPTTRGNASFNIWGRENASVFLSRWESGLLNGCRETHV